jgi:hypothetical protein
MIGAIKYLKRERTKYKSESKMRCHFALTVKSYMNKLLSDKRIVRSDFLTAERLNHDNHLLVNKTVQYFLLIRSVASHDKSFNVSDCFDLFEC